MKVTTFYSYKGGVGRTLAACNFAAHVSRLRQPTVIIDFDLDAPGVDSKFGLELPSDAKGLLDYILEYQQYGRSLMSVRDIAVRVPTLGESALWCIPAGRYLDQEYYDGLARLNWRKIFFSDRDGVRFFQDFLSKVESELAVSVCIVDSRAGVSEIGGICTQQLGDEVVLLTSMASESIRVTRHIARQIAESDVAKALGKAKSTKVVVTRIVKPRDLALFERDCAAQLGIDVDQLFFLLNSDLLTRGDFIAIQNPTRDLELTDAYLKLFAGLQIQASVDFLEQEVSRVSARLLFQSPTEGERAVEELAVLYPHPYVWRALMRFYGMRGDSERELQHAWKILDSAERDDEAEQVIVERFLTRDRRLYLGGEKRPDSARLLAVFMKHFREKRLSEEQRVRLLRTQADLGEPASTGEVAASLLQSSDGDVVRFARRMLIGAKFDLGAKDEVIASMEEYGLDAAPVRVLVEYVSWMTEEDKRQRAIRALLKAAASEPITASLVNQIAAIVPDRLRDELREAILTNAWYRRRASHDPEYKAVAKQLGLTNEQIALLSER